MSLPRRLVQVSKRGAKSLLRPLLTKFGRPAPALDRALWGLHQRNGQGLSFGDLALEPLLRDYGSPLFVVDSARLAANARAFQAVPAGCDAGCEVFYSYKTNPVPQLLRTLHEAEVGAEVISHYELWLARRLGVRPERIVYNGPGKSDESLREALEQGIQIINCNHAEEVARVAEIARGLGRRARIGIRVTTDDGWASQFGTPIAGGAALRLFAEAKASGTLDVVGVHAHRGGMLRSEAELSGFLDAVLGFTERLHAELGLAPEILNFGGSLGLPTVAPLDARARQLNQAIFKDIAPPTPSSGLSLARYLELLVTRVETQAKRLATARPRIFLEPGRAMTGSAQLLLARVLTVKDVGELRFAVLDAGVNIAEAVRSEYHQVFALASHPERPLRVHRVVGPICTPGDLLYPALRLPELQPGDALAIMDAGAYFVPFSTSFSFPRPAIVGLAAGQVSLLRRRETFEDLVAYDGL